MHGDMSRYRSFDEGRGCYEPGEVTGTIRGKPQKVMLRTKVTGFIDARSRGRSKAHARSVHAEFSKLWPEKEELYPTEPGAPPRQLTPKQKAKVQALIEKRFKRNSSKRGRAVSKAVKVLMRGHRKRRRAPQASEAYIKLYPAKVQAVYLERKGDQKMTNGVRLNFLRKIAEELLAEEPEEILTKVATKQQAMRDALTESSNTRVEDNLENSALSDVYDGPTTIHGYGFPDAEVTFDANIRQVVEYQELKTVAAALDGIKISPDIPDVSDDEEDKPFPSLSSGPRTSVKDTDASDSEDEDSTPRPSAPKRGAKAAASIPRAQSCNSSSTGVVRDDDDHSPPPRPMPHRVGGTLVDDGSDSDDDEPTIATRVVKNLLELPLGTDEGSDSDSDLDEQIKPVTEEWDQKPGQDDEDDEWEGLGEGDDDDEWEGFGSDAAEDNKEGTDVDDVRKVPAPSSEAGDAMSVDEKPAQSELTTLPTPSLHVDPVKHAVQPATAAIVPTVDPALLKRAEANSKRLETRARNKALKEAKEAEVNAAKMAEATAAMALKAGAARAARINALGMAAAKAAKAAESQALRAEAKARKARDAVDHVQLKDTAATPSTNVMPLETTTTQQKTALATPMLSPIPSSTLAETATPSQLETPNDKKRKQGPTDDVQPASEPTEKPTLKRPKRLTQAPTPADAVVAGSRTLRKRK
ncbi:hypothetical protein BDN72DRAFT_865589 [Pluteus cervinus]|uniref:Uncharacterized protein n=1 Tax=Pluteus cervinus TaxID=181527 RepID=A0ACD2ZZN4_9AGAR|nr:hypothetical protein BDN72DRAFT_865589 [Pluteus cervinus]